MPTSRQHLVGLGYRVQLSGTSGTQFGEAGVQAFTLDFDHDDAYRTAEPGRGVHPAGALVQHYDGDRWAEADFHCAPDTASGTIVAKPSNGSVWPGAGLSPESTYVYKICYEEIDGQGELHPGAVSVGTLFTTGEADDTCTIAIPDVRLTSKRRVRIGVIRSLAGATGDPEAIRIRVSSIIPTATGANGYPLNDPTVDTITFVDQMLDTTAVKLELLYTNGGVLSNDPIASGGEVVAGGKYRLFWTDPIDGAVVNYSKQLASSDTAAEMSPFLSQRTDPFGGDIVAISTMDDNVIVFKETAIYAFGGPGPAPDGGLTTQDAFTPAQLVTRMSAARAASSVRQMPLGVVSRATRGSVCSAGDLNVRRIGDPVFAYNAQTITRSTLSGSAARDPDEQRTDAALRLRPRSVVDVSTNHEGYDAIVVGGSYYYLAHRRARAFVETIGA